MPTAPIYMVLLVGNHFGFDVCGEADFCTPSFVSTDGEATLGFIRSALRNRKDDQRTDYILLQEWDGEAKTTLGQVEVPQEGRASEVNAA